MDRTERMKYEWLRKVKECQELEVAYHKAYTESPLSKQYDEWTHKEGKLGYIFKWFINEDFNCGYISIHPDKPDEICITTHRDLTMDETRSLKDKLNWLLEKE